MTNEEMEKYINDNQVKCPHCGNFTWTPIRQFKLMFETSRGTLDGEKDIVYLRPETCQGEYVNFLNIQRSMRAKVPFAIAQIGKSFRNEITPGNFIFRTIEFEQMELQKFVKEDDGFPTYEDYKKKAYQFLLDLNFSPDHLKYHDHDKLAFYAKAACDIFYLFPMGWSELNGIHHRSTHDLSRHQEFSGKSMLYLDPVTNEKYIPNVIEYSIGADRLMLAVLSEAYTEEELEGGDTRVVLKLHPAIAPYKVAILPLQKNISEKAVELYQKLSKKFMCMYDESGSIGKRYRRQDSIGTPFCVTVDFDSNEQKTYTLRNRNTMEQVRLSYEEIVEFVKNAIKF